MANKRRFRQVDDLMTRDKRFRELDDPWERWALIYLYITPNNRDGLVHESMEEIAEYSGIARDDLPAILDGLRASGRIHRGGIEIVLMDWREWMGGHKDKDDDGFLRVSKGMVERVRLNRRALDDDVFHAYVRACGFDTSDAFFAVEDQPDPRGGDRRSKAFKSRSKPDQKLNSVLADVEVDVEQEVERDVADVRGRSAAATTVSREGIEVLANEYSKEFVGREVWANDLEGSPSYGSFAKAAERLKAFADRAGWTVAQARRHLFNALKDEWGGKDSVKPGNLSCGDTWTRILPAYLKELYG